MLDRKQQNSVKQLSFNKQVNKNNFKNHLVQEKKKKKYSHLKMSNHNKNKYKETMYVSSHEKQLKS